MEHPANFLTTGFKLTPESWRKLSQNCAREEPGPGPGETTFTFSAGSINDVQDVVITADRQGNTFRCRPKPHCACSQQPLECQCLQLQCHVCGANLTGTSGACGSILCVDDNCPLCQHQREDCLHEQLRAAVAREAETESRRSALSQAGAYVAAVAEVLAPGVGDAPIFPATVRILDTLIGAHQGKENNRTGPDALSWTCQDGSVVLQDPRFTAWLMDAEPGTTPEDERDNPG